MRIVIDLQGAQSESRYRGIGRYSLALALSIARNAGDHEIWLVLNGALGAAIADIREAFVGLVPNERIRVFDVLSPTAESQPQNSVRARASETLREHFIAQLQADAVLVTSLFEGYLDDTVVSIGTFSGAAKTAVVLYDLIPFLNPETYLSNEIQRAYYFRKVESLRRAGLLLSISAYSRQEAIDTLGLAPERVVSISTAVDASFAPLPEDASNPERAAALRRRFGLNGAYVMYAPGGFDARKNIDGLISAYSMLPRSLRDQHQLLIASKLSQNDREHLERHARHAGISAGQLILTGYVDDVTLIDLYRHTELFVFPSKHEGFGLPALEAMACGALVIGANNTSIPEVIGCEEAMFDANDPASIASRIEHVLTDAAFRDRLREHGQRQARVFSWDHSAQSALKALEQLAQQQVPLAPTLPVRPRIAFVSPLPPERTGVADYAVRLLPTLLPHFDVTLIAQQDAVSLPADLRQLACHDAAWLRAHADQFEHIVYQFGNSPFHSYMLPLLRDHAGVVVLHDFFLSSMLSYEQMSGAMPGIWNAALLKAHGYVALQTNQTPEGWELAKEAYPCNLDILQHASHVIVHSEYARQLARDWYGPQAGHDWSLAQLPRAVPLVNSRDAARQILGIHTDTFLVCNFGFIAPSKHCMALLQAWLASPLHQDQQCLLVFVGANHGGDYGQQIIETIRAAGAQDRVRISGWISDDDYLHYLQAADVGVQLRTSSRGETSGTVLDCMIYGLPTIINANGSMAEFAHDAVWMLPDRFTQRELSDALTTLHDNAPRRLALGKAGFDLMLVRNSPERCGLMYTDALARAALDKGHGRRALIDGLLANDELANNQKTLLQLAQHIAHAPDALAGRQLLVDVTAIARHDLKTGIERVVRTQLLELMRLRAAGFRVEPVYLSHEGGHAHYRYARDYAASLLGLESLLAGKDRPIDSQPGDVFYCADHSPHAVMDAARAGVYADWRARGIEINFVVYDLLPILHPEFFPQGADVAHAAWLSCVGAEADRLISISAAVADDTAAWLQQHGRRRGAPLKLTSLHLGADIGAASSSQSAAVAPDGVPVFLMVGTIEPRKGHLQAIDAFEQLWRAGVEAQLIIVGNEGWLPLEKHQRRTIPHIVERLNQHPEMGQRLQWLRGVDDARLLQLYRSSVALLQPSEGEGFGLPLIEAASHDLPLIVRDLAVFREVAGNGAHYFSGMHGSDLAAAIESWLDLYKQKRHPLPNTVRAMTWAENAGELLAIFAGQGVHRLWPS